MVRIEVFVDGESVMEGLMDGLIVATPTGSSAHALSAGGPLVDPRLNVLLLVPLAPFSSLVKPLVLSPERAIEVRVLDDSSVLIDGIKRIMLPIESRVRVLLRSGGLRLVRVPGGQRLKVKLQSRLMDVPPWSL